MLYYLTIKVSDGTEFYLPTIVVTVKHTHTSEVTIRQRSKEYVMPAEEEKKFKLMPGRYIASADYDGEGNGFFILTLNLRYNPILDIYSSLMQKKSPRVREKLAEAESYIKMLQDSFADA